MDSLTKYDDGSTPSVAMNANGVVVAVHEAVSSLWCHLGVLAKQDSIKWGVRHRYDSGTSPCVAVNNCGCVVEVHQSQEGEHPTLCYRVGEVNIEKRRVEWSSRHKCGGDGIAPAVAITDCGKVVIVHGSSSHVLHYRMGKVDACSKKILFSGSKEYGRGMYPSVALNKHLEVVEVHCSQSSSDELCYLVGTLDGDEINFNESIHYGNGVQPSIALTDKGQVMEAHKSEAPDMLWLHRGMLVGTTLSLGQGVSYGSGTDPSVAVALNGSAQFVGVHARSSSLWYNSTRLSLEGESVWWVEIRG